MSRVHDAAQDYLGEWRDSACPRCAGDNQRTDGSRWWFGARSDSICTLCRCEVEAEEQEAELREQQWIAEQAERQRAWEDDGRMQHEANNNF